MACRFGGHARLSSANRHSGGRATLQRCRVPWSAVLVAMRTVRLEDAEFQQGEMNEKY